jgi:uncharacterized protein (DUF433 family)
VTANIRELAELYLETLSIDERDTLLSREILTTVVEVNASTTVADRRRGRNACRVRLASRCYSPIMSARISIEPGKRSGQPCVRGLRITVWDVLSWLAAGMTEQEILGDYPELEADDFPAVYDFAAHMGRRVAL